MPLTRIEFDYLRQLVRERSAIVLDDSKEYLVEMRLMSLARLEGHDNVDELSRALRGKPFSPLHAQVVDAMTTNETSFFRDLHPFDTFKKELVPELINKNEASRSLNIWCAACSSGQEPYTLAMLLHEGFPQLRAGWRVNLLAGDLSQEMLRRARQGLFSQLEVNRGLPAPLLVKYFQKDGAAWQVKDEIRAMIQFHELNLAAALWPTLPAMDVVFIRNVLIYFDIEMKRQILRKVRSVLRPDGILFLGGAETTLNIDEAWERVQTGKTVYYRIRRDK
jgi:chemotaxis protein methyltransferase CheR